MISLDSNDTYMLTHAAEVMGDRIADNGNGYSRDDDMSVDKIEKMGKLSHAFVVSGDVVTVDEAAALMKQVVLTEINSWVSDSSQRLIYRAARALSIDTPYFRFLGCTDDADHGPAPQDHALIQDWVCGIYTMRCATCGHLYRV